MVHAYEADVYVVLDGVVLHVVNAMQEFNGVFQHALKEAYMI